jgi:hypothetical protein
MSEAEANFILFDIIEAIGNTDVEFNNQIQSLISTTKTIDVDNITRGLINNDYSRISASQQFHVIFTIAKILLDPKGTSANGRSMLIELELKLSTQCSDFNMNECIGQVTEGENAYNSSGTDVSIQNQQVIECWLLFVAVKKLKKIDPTQYKVSDLLSFSSRSIHIVSRHIDAIQSNKSQSEDLLQFLSSTRNEMISLERSIAKESIQLLLRHQSHRSLDDNQSNNSATTKREYNGLSSIRKKMDSQKSLLHIQLSDLSGSSRSLNSKSRDHELDKIDLSLAPSKKGKMVKKIREKTEVKHYLYPHLMNHPSFY